MAASILKLAGTKVLRETDFMGAKVQIYKLTIAQTEEIQKYVQENLEGEEGAEDRRLKAESAGALSRMVIRMGVEDGAELTDEQFASLPRDEVEKLMMAVMKHSGIEMGGEKKGK